jgi:hypothetical protein
MKIVPIVRRPIQRMSKAEMDVIARALKAKVHAAKTGILARAPKLLADFEGQMELVYPPSGDKVWAEALNTVMKVYEVQAAIVEARCRELGIPERFRPQLTRPGWISNWKGASANFRELREEMRRLAAIMVDDQIKSRLAKLEADSADIQCELAMHGCVTDAAKEFLANLPSVAQLIPPLKVAEVEALIEGRATDILAALMETERLQLQHTLIDSQGKPLLPPSE